MAVLPLASIGVDRFFHGLPLMHLVERWFVFWGAGARFKEEASTFTAKRAQQQADSRQREMFFSFPRGFCFLFDPFGSLGSGPIRSITLRAKLPFSIARFVT